MLTLTEMAGILSAYASRHTLAHARRLNLNNNEFMFAPLGGQPRHRIAEAHWL
jgi:hypothetical protein